MESFQMFDSFPARLQKGKATGFMSDTLATDLLLQDLYCNCWQLVCTMFVDL